MGQLKDWCHWSTCSPGLAAWGLRITFACRFGWQCCSTSVSCLVQTSFTSWILNTLLFPLYHLLSGAGTALVFMSQMVRDSETVKPERLPQISTLIFYNSPQDCSDSVFATLRLSKKSILSQMHHELANRTVCVFVCVRALTRCFLCQTPWDTITATLLWVRTQHSALPHCWVSGHLWTGHFFETSTFPLPHPNNAGCNWINTLKIF